MFKFIIFTLTISCISSEQIYKCIDGEYADDSDPKKCKQCPEHCVTCISSTVCTSCSNKYFLYSAGDSCELKTLITTTNCIDIVDKEAVPTVCSKCADKYWLKDDAICSAVTLTTCETWKSGVNAEECQTFAYNCTKINEKCTQCSSNTVCIECAQGYFLSSDSVCQVKTGSCLTWKKQILEECDTCPDGYTITNKIYCYASQCLYSVNNSVSCGNGKTRSSAPFCNILCSDSHCKDCSDETSVACLECMSGYLVSGGQCLDQTVELENCTQANTADPPTCEICKSGFTVLSGVCQINLEHCTKMADESSCQTCQDGYYLNSDTPATCTVCNTNCLCTDDTAMCTDCLNRFFYENENCNTACVDTHCLVCSPANTCTTCESGYGKELDGTCTQCIDTHCTGCGVAGKSCTGCQKGYYLDLTESAEEAICVECSSLNSKYIETTCTNSQRVNFPWTCTDLIGNCKENTPTPLIGESSQSCKVCSPGYHLDINSLCTKCPDNCYNCQSNVAQCEECSFGYYLSANLCIKCDATCQKCSSTECLDCVVNYAYSADNALVCVPCVANCDRCDVNVTCMKCSSKYYLNEGSCVACSTNCTDCDSSKCYACLGGSYLDGTVCKDCPVTCKECTNIDTCTSCKEQYFLNETKCSKCLENCKLCSNSSNCAKCNDNYKLNEENTTCTLFNGKECFDSISGCIKCDASIPTVCALCEFGSVPINGKCTCESGKILFEAQCVDQVSLPENFSTSSLDTLATYLVKSFENNETKANNTQKILTRINAILSADGGNTSSNAQKSLQFLLYSANTATITEAKTLYSTILTTVCGITTLTELNYYIAFAAADKFITTSTDKNAIYQLGFSTCITNLLKNIAQISDISLMKMTNSEFIMQKFTNADINKIFALTGVSITANDAFMTAVGDGTFYATVQAITNTANPYSSEQTNTDITLSSKIVSFSVMTAGSTASAKTITLSSNGTFPITFDKTDVTGRCGYYDTTSKK